MAVKNSEVSGKARGSMHRSPNIREESTCTAGAEMYRKLKLSDTWITLDPNML